MANIIAVIWDFDKTLIDGYMEDPIFDAYGVDAKKFWDETSSLPKKYFDEQNVKVNAETVYLNQFIKYTKNGIFKGLNNKKLRAFGEQMKFYPGVPEIFDVVKNAVESHVEYRKYDIKVEHYIVSSGLTEIIKGSAVAQYVSGIWGCEFIEAPDENGNNIISEIGYTIDNTTKTRALFEINKGVGKIDGIEVNTSLPEEHRRVHFINMIYVADGPSDIPAFSVINQFGGSTFAVYPSGNMQALKQVEQMRRDGRVNMFSEADYSYGKTACLWLCNTAEDYAVRICESERERLQPYTRRPLPRHFM